MPAPLSQDLRRRVLDASRSLSASKTAERFGVSIRTVHRLRALDRATGSTAPKRYSQRGRAPKLTEADRPFFEALLAENPSATYPDMAERFSAETGRPVSRSTVREAFVRWKLTRKKR